MAKLAFLTPERRSRVVLTALLALGILLPLLMLFNLGAQIPLAMIYTVLTLSVLIFITVPRWRWLSLGLAAAWALVQLLLPGMGFWGGSVEAFKAIILFFNDIDVAMPLFGGNVAALLAVAITAFSFLFTKKDVGFLPASILVVLTLFGLWSLGRSSLVWFALPALVAMLLLISQTSHAEISVMNVLPMALAVVLLSLLLLPPSRVTIPPLEEAAFNLRQTITDYLFFTKPRNVFTLGSYGYYPLGSGQLGGEAEPSDYPVMMVKTDRKTLMRAVVKDEYTGRSFRDTSSPKRYLYINPRWSGFREKVFMEKLPVEGIRRASALLDEKAVNVQMQNSAASTVFTPLFLRSLDMKGNMVPYFNDASELFITRDLAPTDRYTVFAPVFEGGDGGLDALIHASPKDDRDYEAIVAQYTRLPGHLEQKVYEDVDAMTAASAAPYDKAMAVMRYLQKYFRYTLSPKNTPENADFVTYFLHVGKEGYCTYYAAAMTVLCRMAGLPSRYVEGFLAQPASDGIAYVTGKDAHAWTEVYFEGFGWVPFDPTPMQQGERESPPENGSPTEEEPTPSPPPEDDPPSEDDPTPSPPPDSPEEPPTPPPPETEQDSEDEDPSGEAPEEKPPFPWWVLAVAVVAGGLAWHVRIRMPDQLARKVESVQDRIFLYGNAVNTILRLRGRRPKQGETPLRFAKRVDSVHILPEPILPLWRMMALSNYSGRLPGNEQAQRAALIFRKTYKSQKMWTKIRFLFTAAFGNRCYTGLDTVLVHVEPASKFCLPEMGGKKGAKKGKGRKTRSSGPGTRLPPAPRQD